MVLLISNPMTTCGVLGVLTNLGQPDDVYGRWMCQHSLLAIHRQFCTVDIICYFDC